MGLEQAPAGGQDYVRQERLLTQRLDIVTENRMVIIPFETEVLGGHYVLLCFTLNSLLLAEGRLYLCNCDDFICNQCW